MEVVPIQNPKPRVQSVDVLRGIIMVVMALDHTRDFFSNAHNDPLDFNHLSAWYFFTRWITHFCAPVFVFLSGSSVFLSMSRGKPRRKAAWMLLTRGLMLVVLEITVMRLGWSFNMNYQTVFVQVIWALGWCMIFLAGLIFLPRAAIVAFGLLLVFGHNAFDGVQDTSFTVPILWDFFHEPGYVMLFGGAVRFHILYPLVPWVGVMALGYCFGTVLQKPVEQRDKWLYIIGGCSVLLFVLLRYINIYGDPRPWRYQYNPLDTVLDFIKCRKYPPSLLYLLMTLGPSILAMPLLEKATGKTGRFFTVYGRVPFFYYVLHVYLIHSVALVLGLIEGFPFKMFTTGNYLVSPDTNWGFSLPWVYLIWICVVLTLYYPCRWYMHIKMRHKKWWLSYL